jgi:hypothetical protein
MMRSTTSFSTGLQIESKASSTCARVRKMLVHVHRYKNMVM